MQIDHQFSLEQSIKIENNPSLAMDIRSALATNAAILLKNVHLDEDNFEILSKAIGQNAVINSISFTSKYVKNDKDTKFQTPDLPLHTDGVIIQNSTDAIVFYVKNIEQTSYAGKGDLILSRHDHAFKQMPNAMKHIILQQGLEYRVLDRTPFPFLPEGWFTIPTLREVDQTSYLYLALPFNEEEKPLWQVRVKGMTKEKSDNFLIELKSYLMQAKFYSRHTWQTGDLLIVDNRKVFHGFYATGSRPHISLLRKNITLN